MAIEEKKRAIEFTYIKDNGVSGGSLKYDIVYDESQSDFPLIISTMGGGCISYPLELFEEVVAFLQSKGVSRFKYGTGAINNGEVMILPSFDDKSNNTRNSVMPVSSKLPIPNIKKKNYEKEISRDIDPLASFDINREIDDEFEKKEVLTENTDIKPSNVKEKGKKAGPKISNTNEIPPEAFARPVIRTRLRDSDDEMESLKESNALRTAQLDTSNKTIRRS